MNVSSLKLNARTVEQIQLVELSRRSRVSIAFSVPALLTAAGVHCTAFPVSRIGLWLSAMLLIQALRFAMAQRIIAIANTESDSRRWIRLEIFCAAVSGIGWGALFFALDSKALDFLFLFKFIVISAAMVP